MENKDNTTDGKIAVVTSISESGGVQVEYYDKDDPRLQEMDLDPGIDFAQEELEEKQAFKDSIPRLEAIVGELQSLGIDYKYRIVDDVFPHELLDRLEPLLSLARLGKNLSKARDEAGLSQSDLASRLYTNRQQISRYELAEQEMSVLRLVNIAKALHVSAESLLEGVDLDP